MSARSITARVAPPSVYRLLVTLGRGGLRGAIGQPVAVLNGHEQVSTDHTDRLPNRHLRHSSNRIVGPTFRASELIIHAHHMRQIRRYCQLDPPRGRLLNQGAGGRRCPAFNSLIRCGQRGAAICCKPREAVRRCPAHCLYLALPLRPDIPLPSAIAGSPLARCSRPAHSAHKF